MDALEVERSKAEWGRRALLLNGHRQWWCFKGKRRRLRIKYPLGFWNATAGLQSSRTALSTNHWVLHDFPMVFKPAQNLHPPGHRRDQLKQGQCEDPAWTQGTIYLYLITSNISQCEPDLISTVTLSRGAQTWRTISLFCYDINRGSYIIWSGLFCCSETWSGQKVLQPIPRTPCDCTGMCYHAWLQKF